VLISCDNLYIFEGKIYDYVWYLAISCVLRRGRTNAPTLAKCKQEKWVPTPESVQALIFWANVV